MAHEDLPGFGVEIAQLEYDGWLDWFVKFNDIQTLWKAQPTYILSQIVFLIGAAGNLIHAILNGGRLPFLWLATLLHGVVVEIITYNLDDIDNFWHSQTPVMFVGRRLPLHIIGLYPVFIYHASVAVAKLRLPTWAEPFAVGLTVVLIDIPYDIVSVKFLHWTWHDTDPNIEDRHYWVPWNSYYFHACFAASFTFWFHGWRRWLGSDKLKWEAGSFWKEFICVVMAGVLGMPGGVLLFLPIYHPLHDLAGIHSEVTFFILFTVFLLICWTGDRTPSQDSRPALGMQSSYDKGKSILIIHLIIHYALFLGLTVFGNPEEEVSVGLHEKVGPCSETVPVQTAFGTVLSKRHYLCATDYDEDYFDFHCLSKGKVPSAGSYWYTACGTPFRNRAEYIAILTTICILAFTVFRNLHFKSGPSVQQSRIKAKRY